MEYVIKAISGKHTKLSKPTNKEKATSTAESMFFFGDYSYVSVESTDGVLICEYEIWCKF